MPTATCRCPPGRIPSARAAYRANMRHHFIALLGLLILACGSPAKPVPTVEEDLSESDAQDAGPIFGTDATKGDSGGDAPITGKTGVWLDFAVDDSANQTFAGGDIRWTGSFAWTGTSNSIAYASSWLPKDGPYPALWDDGPIAKGGHEQDDGVAGDHILTTKVWFDTAAGDTTFEYGALNEKDNWMWIGPNGTLLVKKGQTGTVHVPGLVLKKFGLADIKITLDLKALNATFATWATGERQFFVKGTMNQWTAVQLLDDGEKGDEKAGDGVLTYVQSQRLIKHVGLVPAGEEVQFIFVSTQNDEDPIDGQEYKAATEAYKDGVQAWTAGSAGGAWQTAAVILSKDSKGKFLNTAILVPMGQIVECTPACAANQTCTAGQCVDNPPPACTPACAVDETCKDGQCIKNPPPTCQPGCLAGETCTAGSCVKNPAALTVLQVDPSKGWTTGGQQVSVAGSGFAAGATVSLGGAAAKVVSVAADGTTLLCTTPVHESGLVDVVVTNPDSKTATLSGGFYFQVVPAIGVSLAGGAVLAGNDKDAIPVSIVVKIAGITEDVGAVAGLKVELGHGPAGTDPVTDAASWQFAVAAFVSENAVKGEETYAAQLPVLAVGKYALAARATWQGQTGTSPPAALTITVKSTVPTLTGASPAFVAAKGGKLTLLGDNLTAAASVKFVGGNGKTVDAKSVVLAAGQGLLVETPPLPPLPAQVLVKPVGGTELKLAGGLDVVPIDTPIMDGTVDGSVVGDWNAYSLAALQSLPSDWDNNGINGLYVAYDATNLYLGVQGACEATNAIVAYLDVDYGAGTGVQNPVDLKDNAGAVDDAIAGVLKSLDVKIGLDFAFASIGMVGFEGVDLIKSTAAGWRNLAVAGDFGWLPAAVKTSAGAVETAIPLATLYPNGVPAVGVTLKYVILIGNANGSAVSNQFLPGQDAPPDATTISTWGTLRVHPVAP